MAAIDQRSGEVLWESQIDDQPGSDVYSSPVYFDDMIFTGWSGGSAELGDEADRYAFQGGFAIFDADTGELLKTITKDPLLSKIPVDTRRREPQVATAVESRTLAATAERADAEAGWDAARRSLS